MKEFRVRAIQGVLWSATGQWGANLTSVITLTVLARLLSPEAFGLVAMASVMVAFINIFVDLGLGDAIVQRSTLNSEHLNSAFWAIIIIGGLFTGCGVLSAHLVAELFDEPRITPIIQWLSVGFIISSFSAVQLAILQRKMEFKSIAIVQFIARISGGFSGVLLAVLGYGYWSLVIQSLVNSIVGAIVLWRMNEWRPYLRFSILHFMDMFNFGVNILGNRFLNFFSRRSDDLLVGYFLGPVALGYYAVAYQVLLTMIDLFVNIINSVAFPAFSRLQNDREKLRDFFYVIVQSTATLSMPAFLGFATVAPEFVRFFYGEQWEASIPVMQVLALIGILHSVFYYNGSILNAVGKPNWNLAFNFVNTVCNVLVFYFTVRWGIQAVAIGFVLRGYLLAPLKLWVVKRFIDIDYHTYMRQLGNPLYGSIIMGLVIVVLKPFLPESFSNFMNLTTLIGMGIVIYFIWVYLSRRDDLHKLIEFAQPLLPRKQA